MSNEPIQSERLPPIKKYVVKKHIKNVHSSILHISYSIVCSPKENKKIKLTIARKLKDLDENFPSPGSLEDDLVTPDAFFTIQSSKNFNSPKIDLDINAQEEWKKLCPIDIFSREKVEQKHKEHVNFADDPGFNDIPATTKKKGKSSFKSMESFTNKGGDQSKPQKIKKIKTIDATNEDIMIKYNDVGSRLCLNASMQNTSSAFRSTKNRKEFYDTAQERFFDTYNTSQRQWNQYLYTTCAAIGRDPGDSVAIRADEFREKQERSRALENANATALIYGAQGWYLSLRQSNKFNDLKHYSIPIGGLYNGLWMRVTDNPHKPEMVIRSPIKIVPKSKKHTYKDNPFLIAKQKAEARRLTELIPVKDDEDLQNLMVIGKEAYRVEIEGFRKCNKPKVIEINTKSDDGNEDEQI